MNKYCKAFLFILFPFLLNAFVGCGRLMVFDNSNKTVDARMEQLLLIVANKDENALKEMFSTQALADTSSFDDGMKYLFDLIEGNVLSWKQERYSSDGLRMDGKEYQKLFVWYTVVTDKGEYLLFTSDYIINTICPDNVGLYTLRAIEKIGDEVSFDVDWDDLEIPGIYTPDHYLERGY